MPKLSSSKVYRAGRTARSWNYETDSVSVGTAKSAARLNFNLSSKGGGITEVQLEIGAQDFPAVIRTMLFANRTTTMQAIAAALATELANQSEQDRLIKRRARESVVEAADLAFSQAPAGKDHAERLTRDVVSQLVAQLNAADEPASESGAKVA
jgi:hypothetical protein